MCGAVCMCAGMVRVCGEVGGGRWEVGRERERERGEREGRYESHTCVVGWRRQSWGGMECGRLGRRRYMCGDSVRYVQGVVVMEQGVCYFVCIA